jgi:hypothetical protein
MALLPRFETARTALAVAVAALALASFALALFLPVYTDEILWKAVQGRMAIEGGKVMALNFQPSCGTYYHPVPALLYPFRLLDAFLYAALGDPLAIRVFGMALCLLWIALTCVFACRLFEDQARLPIIAVLLAFATLGVMPFFLVLSRPEQILLIAMTCFLYPLLRQAAPVPTARRSALRAAGGVVLSAFVLAAHPRAVLALPLMLGFLERIARRKWIVAGGSAAVLIFAAVAYRDFSARWACPADPKFASILMHANLGNALQAGKIVPYIVYLLGSLAHGGAWFVDEFVPKSGYTSGLLPPFPVPVLGRAMSIAFAIFVIEGFVAFCHAALVQGWRARWPAFLGIGSLWLFYFASLAVRLDKNDYEAELMEPVMAMAALGSLWLAWPGFARSTDRGQLIRIARGAMIGLLALSVVSQGALLKTYIPYALTTWQEPGYPPQQRFSVSSFGYDRLVPKMLATAQICGIEPGAHPRHLVVDELTSLAFRDTAEPYFLTYFDPKGWGMFRPDPTSLWREKRVAGLIAACERVPEIFADKVKREGALCCLPSFAPS